MLKALKPKPFRGEPKTVGEHIKARRLSLGRYQKDVARELGVDVFTLLNWEKERTEPFAASYPAILAFLGYDPFPPPQTIGERLKAARRMNGWTIKEGADALGVDEATFGDWERGKTILFRKHRERVATFLSIPADVIDERMAVRWGEAHKTPL